jgi:hypothetical protein
MASIVVGVTPALQNISDLAKITLVTGANPPQEEQKLAHDLRRANRAVQVGQKPVLKSLFEIHYSL